MGQKINPHGFRLGITTDHKTRWYADKNYADLVAEDVKIRRFLSKTLERAGISSVEIERPSERVTIFLYAARPGIVIGRKGAAVKDLRQKLKDLTGKTGRVEVEEITQPDANAQLIAENIAGQLERRISHSRAMKRGQLTPPPR